MWRGQIRSDGIATVLGHQRQLNQAFARGTYGNRPLEEAPVIWHLDQRGFMVSWSNGRLSGSGLLEAFFLQRGSTRCNSDNEKGDAWKGIGTELSTV